MSAEKPSLPPAPSGGVIVFDLDGTLVDSVRDLLPALNRTIEPRGLAPLVRDDIGKVVGQGAMRMIETAFSLRGAGLDVDTHKALLRDFLAHYEAHIADETVYFDGCLPLLDRLMDAGWKLAICTNKFAHLAEKLMAALGNRDRFAALTGGDSFDFKKPDGRHITETVRLCGGDVRRSVMVGDSVSDIAGARDAGMPCIAVDFGYTDIPVRDLSPTRAISHFDDFDTALIEIMAARDAA